MCVIGGLKKGCFKLHWFVCVEEKVTNEFISFLINITLLSLEGQNQYPATGVHRHHSRWLLINTYVGGELGLERPSVEGPFSVKHSKLAHGPRHRFDILGLEGNATFNYSSIYYTNFF